ncbi:MAG: hypothetical protein IJS65_04480, partial [Clostridia bacterium]|nr:hypothetical protein [Clostridia bacterium]
KAAYGAETYAAFSGADITELEDHAYAINDRMNSYLLPAMKHGMSVVDVNSVFEYLLKNEGINPWNGKSDFAGKYGDYAIACACYAGVTGKSPVGILKFTAKKTSVEPTRGVAIQKAVARIVLGQTETPDVDITDAYVDRASSNVLFIGGRTLNDNKLPETLGQLLDQARRDNVVMSLTGSETLAEFVDSTSVNVEFSYGGETYDYMVLELGRDDVLYDKTAAEKELAALDKLVALGKANNKQIKIVLVAPAARQNKTGQLYQNQVENSGIKSASEYAKLISAYAKKLAGENYVVCDIAQASMLAQDAGINPYANYVSDNLSADGSYLTACMLYNAMFGAMPADMTYTGGANADNAKTLREIAASMFEG